MFSYIKSSYTLNVFRQTAMAQENYVPHAKLPFVMTGSFSPLRSKRAFLRAAYFFPFLRLRRYGGPSKLCL